MLLTFIMMFIGGMLSFFAPCTLPILPAYLAFSSQPSRVNVMLRTISFSSGVAIVFLIFGMLAGTIGNFIGTNKLLITKISGLLFIMLGSMMILGKDLPGFNINAKTERTFLGSFIFGLIFALSWSGCIGPILGFALVMAANTQTAITGGLLLLIFTLGLMFPLLLVSTFIDKLPRDGKVWNIMKGKVITIGNFKVHSTNLFGGIMLILLGLIFFSEISNYFLESSITSFLFDLEDKLAKIFIK